MFAAVAATALGGIHTIKYKLHLAARTYRGAIQMIADPTHVLAFEARLGLAKTLYEWNELKKAESLALLCSELVTSAKSESESGADTLLVRLMLTRNEGGAAEALLSRTALAAPSGQLTNRMKEAAELRVILISRRGEVQNAADLANTYELPVGFARTQMARGKGSDALLLVESYRRSMKAQRRQQDVAKAMVEQLIIHQANGEEDSALQLLRIAVARAQEPGAIRLFVDEVVPMKMLLTKLQQEAEFEQYASPLLCASGDQGPSAKHVSPAKVASPSQFSPNAFSQRELEILRLIQQGLSNQNIGEQLFVSLSTVKWHNQNIFAKLSVQRRTEAVARALQLKLL
jgi:LuxR family transcriptional regulator, maltose regulon positive regulatory protein